MGLSGYTYQRQDSLNTFQSESNQDTTQQKIDTSFFPIELIEEVDEAPIESVIVSPKKQPKKAIFQSKEQLPQQTQPSFADTVNYGIKTHRLQELPVRKPIAMNDTTMVQQEKPTILFSPEIKYQFVGTWQAILLVLSVLLIAIAKAFNAARFKQIASSLFSNNSMYEAIRSEKMFFNQANLLLHLVAVISISMFLYDYLLYKDLFYNSTSLFYLKIAVFVLIFYAVKQFLGMILNYLFDFHSLSAVYVYLTSIHTILAGVVLVPLMVLNYFSSFGELSGYRTFILVFVAMIFIINIIRLFLVGKQKNISVLHIISYLCTLEILPLIVIIKYFIF